MIVHFGRSCAILCLVWLAGGSRAEVKVENKAYQNIVVSFSPRMNPEFGNMLLNSMNELLKEASSVLQESIGLKIGSVVYHLPLSWNSSSLEGISSAPLSSKELTPNIRVEGITDSAFGQQPYALQYGGCGVPGVDITIPDNFLVTLPTEYPKGKILAREWLKYRYGVFDENGFRNDPKYPLHFTIGGSDITRVTDCTFPEAHYHFKDSNKKNCSLESENCHVYPDEESIENVKSSLMFFQESLPNITHICGKDNYLHNEESPNKQNTLCTYQSIWEVIKSSEDFKTSQKSRENEDIQFSYVQESRIRVVLSWPDTTKLLKQGDTIKNLVRKFLYDLPLHSKYIVYPFNAESESITDFIERKEDSDLRAVRIPSIFGEENEGCISCAIDNAANQLLKDDANQKGTIFMIAVSNPEENKNLVNKLKNSNLCLVVAALPGATKDGWNQLIETSKCNSIREISDLEDSKKVLESLYEAMETILPLSLDDTRTSTVVTDWLSGEMTISIPANPLAYSFTLWIFHDYPERSIICEAEKNEIELSTVIESSQPLSSYSFLSENKNVSCRCRYPSSCVKSLTQVRMISQKGAYFVVDSWIHDTTPKDSETQVQMPVIIYARLNYGQHPIQGAEVKAVITGPNDQQLTIPLFDDGKGDPDITLYDGIYSRYFTQFLSEGEYTVKIIANDNGKNARYGKNGKGPCCGSIVQSESSELSSFQLSSTTSFQAISARPEEGYKPSRVVDLKADSSDLPNSITLKWSAPGGEADHGNAHSYILKSFTSREDALQRFNDSEIGKYINVTLSPKTISDSEEFKIDLDDFEDNTTYYLALRSASENSLFSDTSNLVVFVIPSGARTTAVEDDTTEPPSQKTGGWGPQTIGLVVGLVILVIVIAVCIYLAVYCFFVKPKRKKEEQGTGNNASRRRHSGSLASKYEFNVFCQHEDCNKDSALPKWIVFDNEAKPLIPKEYGNEENVTFLILESAPENVTAYFALRAVSSRLQYGDLSNRVYVEIAPIDQDITTNQRDRVPKSPTVGSIIGYVIISIAILLVIVGVIYFLSTRAKRSREFEELKTPQVHLRANSVDSNIFSFKSTRDTNAFDNPMQRADSFPVLLYTHDQLRDLKGKTKDPPLYKPDREPKPWVSLSALSSGANELNEEEESSSTIQADDIKTESNEMKQLDDISHTSEPSQRKTSNF